jgi:hypothetical protein
MTTKLITNAHTAIFQWARITRGRSWGVVEDPIAVQAYGVTFGQTARSGGRCLAPYWRPSAGG